MKLVRKLFLSLVVLGMVAALSFGPGSTQVVVAGNIISYKLFATDTYIQLADGTILYNYGFVGGRDSDYVVYQNSMVAPPKAPKTFVLGGLIDGTPGGPGTGGACQGLTWGAAANTPACVAQIAGNAQFPAPLIRAAVGNPVEIRLVNLGVANKSAPNDPHSIHLHGLDVNAANDGVPETSVGAIPANLAVPGAGNAIYYYFSPQNAGTYMYHCHQEADIHVQMGMFGALVVYEPTDASYQNWLTGNTAFGTGGTLMGATWTKETVLLLSEFDIRQHASEQNALGGSAAFNPVTYQPQYWSINGLSFPNTIHAGLLFNWTNWIKAHPGYDPLIIGSVGSTTGLPDKVLLRVINMGFETQPMHMHGFHGKILGSDQRAWTWGYNPQVGVGLEKNTLTIGSGETYEWLLDFNAWTNAGSTSNYQPGTETRYNPGTLKPDVNTNESNPAIPVPGVPGVTYIGGPTVTGALGIPMVGQLFPFHNHDDYKATNNGVYPGGMFTMIMTTP